MQLTEFISPFTIKEVRHNSLGSVIEPWDRKSMSEKAIWLVGVSDFSGRTQNSDLIRQKLYEMAQPIANCRIVDLGNVISSSEVDQYEAVQLLILTARKNNSLVLLLGGVQISNQFFKNIYRESDSGCVIVDKQIRPTIEFEGLKKEFYIGVQSCYNFVDKDSLNIEFVRLGLFRDKKTEVEPFFRSSNFSVFNMESVRFSDFLDAIDPSPNGLYAEELCQLAWFAGNSNTQEFVVLMGYDFTDSADRASVALVAQALWYLIEGFSDRVAENPEENIDGFKEYYIENNKLPDELVFYHSKRSSKYWMKYGKSCKFIPCSKKDMDDVLQNNIPDRLWKKIHNS